VASLLAFLKLKPTLVSLAMTALMPLPRPPGNVLPLAPHVMSPSPLDVPHTLMCIGCPINLRLLMALSKLVMWPT
jgi:hypothetical protein